jgi:hypothetical protein
MTSRRLRLSLQRLDRGQEENFVDNYQIQTVVFDTGDMRVSPCLSVLSDNTYVQSEHAHSEVHNTDLSGYLEIAAPNWRVIVILVSNGDYTIPARQLTRYGDVVRDTSYDSKGNVLNQISHTLPAQLNLTENNNVTLMRKA